MNKNVHLIALAESDRTSFGRVEFAEQSEPQKVFSAIWALESEVNMGGFAAYFAGSEGETANFAPQALRTIGAEDSARIVERAIEAVSPTGLPESDEQREELIGRLDEEAMGRLNELDEEFMSYPNDLTGLLFDFVSCHPEEFGQVP